MKRILFILIILPLFTISVRAVTVVSNLTEPSSGGGVAGGGGGGIGNALAVSFTTGPTGGTLNSITLDLLAFGAAGGGPSFHVQIRDDVAGSPDPFFSLESLTGDTTPAPGLNTYSSTGLVLAPSTTYWIQITAFDATFTWETSANDNQTSADGWTIGNNTLEAIGGGVVFGATWTEASTNPGFLSVDATLVPEPSSLALLVLCTLFTCTHRNRKAVFKNSGQR